MKSEKETIYDYATELKLLAFKEELEYTLSLAAGENWSHLHFLTELLGKESVRRRECRRKSRIKSAGFPQMKYLHELEEPYKEVFMWRVFAELSYKQIGQLFGKSENWACVTYHRARNMIRERLEGSKNEK